ncbi:12330_t:CDS:2 [Funneliformis caledonium]|uniref:12330_t:CDS:1 n=1 Tax=Funneliformis caledonium TaxID=1117310 RepID=A0A9N9ETZ2_9GLOM|nr:12330_t:CDS:2 [Funneliformis caledonium]
MHHVDSDGVNPSQASTIKLLTIDSFHDSQSKDEEELARIQAEEEIEKARRTALKDLASKQVEKAAKKRKKVI